MNSRQQTTIRLPVELKEQLQQEADKMGITLNAYIIILIEAGRKGR